MTPGKRITCILLLSLITINAASKILVVFPLFAKSHDILAKGIVNHLLDAGHEVVHVTTFPAKPRANLTQIDVSHIEKRIKEEISKHEDFSLKKLVGQKNFGDSFFFLYMTYEIHRQFLEDEKVINFLSDKKYKFDAVIVEWFFADLIAGIAPLYESPLIWFGTTEAHWQILKVIDETPNPAFNVDVFSSSKPPLSFVERITELWAVLKKTIAINCVVVPFEKMLYNRVFTEIASKRGVTMPSYNEAVYNGSMMFLNSHPSIGTPYRLPQNTVYIGGFHVDTTVKPLPDSIKKIFDDAKHGVIYFSMGSNLMSKDMTEHMRDSLLKIFSKVKQTVIWKFEDDLDNVPSNVHLVKWAPQQSILAHPNLKMFITHGGQLSTTEAIHFGVPVVGIPVYGDQYINMKSAVRKGFGIIVKLAEDMADELFTAIQEILTNPGYKNKATELSSIFHDRPLPPGKELVHWVEHVIRTGGAPHLKSPALHVPFYQKMYLDLIAVLAVLGYVLRKISKKLLGKRKNNVEHKKKTS